MTPDQRKRFEWADRLVQTLAQLPCFHPCDVYGQKTDCGDVMVCGGMCVRCSAVRYVERYEKAISQEKKETV